ncbi:MAG: NERD domain-containing protein [Candidatus Latescibacterota bacterium]
MKYLDDNLPRDHNWTKQQKLTDYNGWLIFSQPFLNGSRPDIIIFNPNVGIVIYEVKDWKLENYMWEKDDEGKETLFVHDTGGRYPIKNPIHQVQHYKEKIIGQLVPIIGESVDQNKKNYGLIKTALYFHKANSKKAQHFLGGSMNYFPIFGYDYLTSNNLGFIVPAVKITKSRYWDKNWNDELISWFNPPYHSLEQGILLKLRFNQEKVGEPSPGHHRVRGVAGSGKTQALAYRAGKLASGGFDVLIVTYNITLWHYIRDMIQRSPFAFDWKRITFNHFHGLCRDILNEFGQEWPSSPQREDRGLPKKDENALQSFFKMTVPGAVKQAIEGKKYAKYDAILIDEGQDYHFEWYDLLNNHFLTDRDELLVVLDKKQNIYERELDWVDKRVTRKGLEKFKDYIDLTVTFRMPRKVAELAKEFSEEFRLNQELKVSKIEPRPMIFHSQHIVWLNIEDEKWLENVFNAYRRLKEAGYHPSDMVFLLPNHRIGMEAVEHFSSNKIEVNHVFEDETESTFHPHKRVFWMGDSRLKMSTIHSFKGWELLNIVMYISQKAPEGLAKLDSIVYTAMTRTRENLIVLNSHPRYRDFGEKFPKHWDRQEEVQLAARSI